MTVALSLETLLGGKQVLPTATAPLQWVSVIRQGLPSAAVESLAKTLRMTQSELAAILGIPERTPARRKKEGLLPSEESARLVRLARVAERAKELFEDMDIALDWLKSRNAALSSVSPLSLMDTEIGAETVLDTLGRIEHGVFA